MRAPIPAIVFCLLVAACGADDASDAAPRPGFVMTTTTTTTTTVPGSETAVESEVELPTTTAAPVGDTEDEAVETAPSTTEAGSPSADTPTTTTTTPPPASLALHHVSTFDPTRDAFADLTSAVALAADENRHALVIVGGDWCRLCLDFDVLLEQEPDLAAAFRNRFVIIKVNRSEENPNEAFMNAHPPVEWLPHFFVYNDAGELLESKDSRTLMVADETYDAALIGAFLARYPIG